MKELAVPSEQIAAGPPKGALGPPSRVRYQVLAFACVLAVVTYIQRLGFSSAAPAIKKSLGLYDDHMGYLATAFLVAYGLFQVPGGLLGDRLGGRHILTLLVLGWSLLTAAAALTVLLPADVALCFTFLLILRFLFGAFQAAGFPVIGRIMAAWMPVTVSACVALLAVWRLAHPVRVDRLPGCSMVRRLLAVVSQPA